METYLVRGIFMLRFLLY